MASFSSTPSIQLEPMPMIQISAGTSSNTIMKTDTSAATAASNVPMALISA